jgi:hypothetical protein
MEVEMQVFESRTGKFTPLSDEQVGGLNETQAAAYLNLKTAADAMTEADAEVVAARAQVNADLEVLADAQRNAPKPPTFHDLWKENFGPHAR